MPTRDWEIWKKARQRRCRHDGVSRLRLTETTAYEAHGFGDRALDRLRLLGDLLLDAATNVTGVRDPVEIERVHFLDSLSLLTLPQVATAQRLVDLGAGGGLPGLVLALARPGMTVISVESQRRKCSHIERAVEVLGLDNVRVCCARIEDHARSAERGSFDVAVSRALAELAVVAEYSLPLLRAGGHMVAMKGSISDQERTRAIQALGILGAGPMEAVHMEPFAGARERWVYTAEKVGETPEAYPRRPGMPAKRPLGASNIRSTEGNAS